MTVRQYTRGFTHAGYPGLVQHYGHGIGVVVARGWDFSIASHVSRAFEHSRLSPFRYRYDRGAQCRAARLDRFGHAEHSIDRVECVDATDEEIPPDAHRTDARASTDRSRTHDEPGPSLVKIARIGNQSL